jgi:hypothetical protein
MHWEGRNMIEKNGYVLSHQNGKPVEPNSMVHDLKNVKRIVRSGEPPKDQADVGSVFVDGWTKVSPIGLDLVWKKV